MKPLRPVANVGELPSVVFGQRSLMWWGTLGFMVIEGWTTALLFACYFYVRQNYETWPPIRTPLPSLVIPGINLLLMLVSFIPATLAARAAKQLDRSAVRLWLTIMSIVVLPTIVLRWWDLRALNVRWDTNAYGTAAWLLVGFHTTLLVLDVADTIGLTLFYWLKPMPAKSFSDTSDNTMYWYFTVGLWAAIYLIVYVGPRIF